MRYTVVIHLLLALLALSPAQGAPAVDQVQAAAAPAPRNDANRVRVDFYGEALCPYCIKFARTQLAEMFQVGLSQIIEFDYIPSGNARLGADGKIVCQHGPNECELNRALACGVALAPSQNDLFDFLSCVEARAEGDGAVDPEAAISACAAKGGMLERRVLDCFQGEMGEALQRRALQRTESLVPAHKWVPWVVVNDVPLFDDFENVATFVCAAYPGYPKPKFCLRPPPPDPSKALARAAPGVCRRGAGPFAPRAPAAGAAAVSRAAAAAASSKQE